MLSEAGVSGFVSRLRYFLTILTYTKLPERLLVNGRSQKLCRLDSFMKSAYRMFRRNGVFYAQHNSTGKQESLHTQSRQEAQKLVEAKNGAESNRLLSLSLARVYISASEPKLATRTWGDVMDHLCSKGRESTRDRRRREMATQPKGVY